MSEELSKRIDDLHKRFDDLRADMAARFTVIEGRFTAVDKRIDGLRADMNQRFTDLNGSSGPSCGSSLAGSPSSRPS